MIYRPAPEVRNPHALKLICTTDPGKMAAIKGHLSNALCRNVRHHREESSRTTWNARWLASARAG